MYDFKKIIKEFDNIDITPPNNPRSWDHCLIIVETGGLRILAWGDNRHDPPKEVWNALQDIDIVLVPVDQSQHVMGFHHLEDVIENLNPSIIVPHHYYIFDLTVRQSTLQAADDWVSQQKNPNVLDKASIFYNKKELNSIERRVDFFGDHVAFDKKLWHDSLD